jgi:hypothetical protein
MGDAFDSARIKLERANKHIKDFNVLLSAFFDESTNRIVFDEDFNGVQKIELVVRDLPDALVCAVGDAIHNLRTALDHIAFEVAVKSGVVGRPLKDISFTTRKSREEFEEAVADRKVTVVGDDWVRFLRSVEPYTGGNGELLHAVTILDNTDKHRQLLEIARHIIVYQSVNDGKQWTLDAVASVDLETLKKGETVTFTGAEMDTDAPILRPHVTFAEIEDFFGDSGLNRRLNLLFEAVRRVYAKAAMKWR